MQEYHKTFWKGCFSTFGQFYHFPLSYTIKKLAKAKILIFFYFLVLKNANFWKNSHFQESRFEAKCQFCLSIISGSTHSTKMVHPILEKAYSGKLGTIVRFLDFASGLPIYKNKAKCSLSCYISGLWWFVVFKFSAWKLQILCEKILKNWGCVFL